MNQRVLNKQAKQGAYNLVLIIAYAFQRAELQILELIKADYVKTFSKHGFFTS